MFPTFGLDKVATQIIGIVILVVLLVGGYYYWKSSVKAEALLEWNKQQQEIVRQEQQKLLQDLTEINKQQENILTEIKERNAALDKKFSELEQYLTKESTVREYKGKHSSDVLKRTFKELNR